MKKVFILFLLLVTARVSFSQNPSNEGQIGITDFELVDGTWSYRGAGNNSGSITGFYDKTSWNSNEYLQGHLREIASGKFRMNYRYLMPGGYDPNYDPGYPLIVMLHGAVERGNCWQAGSTLQCYYGNKLWDPGMPVNGNFNQTVYNSRNNLLNNDHQLLNGGTAHLTARNNAGTRKPNDPTLPSRAWPGFVVFPQMLNGWDSWADTGGGGNNYKNDIYDMIRIVRLMINKYNVDPNRIYIHGLSNGGRGVIEAVHLADWLFAAAAPMSSINTPSLSYLAPSGNLNPSPLTSVDVWSVPLWWFQGGRDGNPTPAYTEARIAELRARGANVRYTKYPNLGHGVWNTAYAEPDFWSWFLSKSKSDLFVAYGTNRACATTGSNQGFPIPQQAGARLSMPREMYAYEWKRNGIKTAETTYQIYVTPGEAGTYEGRFSRVPNPQTEADWNEWSKPVQIGVSAPPTPTMTNTQSIMLTDLNGANTSQFTAPSGFPTYLWRTTLNNQANLNNLGPETSTTVPNFTLQLPASPTRTSYNYRVRVREVDGCNSDPSISRTVWFSDGVAPASGHNIAVGDLAEVTNFTATLNAPVDILLKWNDISSESHYEIWRATEANKTGNWSLIKILDANTIVYLDAGLQPGTRYHYKIRAISPTATSEFVPGHRDKNTTVSELTTTDAGTPTTPQNFQAEIYDTDIVNLKASVQLTWDASTDDYAVHHYRITYGGNVINMTDASTSYVIDGLDINTNYAFTVRAVDNSGNTSGPSLQVNINTKIDGLFYIHNTFFYTDLSAVEEEQWYNREFTGRVPNLDLSVATQDSYVIINYYGYLYVSTPGAYKFRVKHNDGVRVKIGDQIVIYENEYLTSGCPETEMDGTINLPAGYIPVEIRYWQSEDDRCLSWQWQGPDSQGQDWEDVPDARLTTEFNYVAPILPTAVTTLSIQQPYGIDELTLNWSYAGPNNPPASFEVYRATSASGPWTLVNLASGSPYTDPNLIPLTTYFYKLRSVSDNGVSPDGNVASAQTADDTEAPTPPSGLSVEGTTLTSALLEWVGSFDLVGVVAYQIYVIPPLGDPYVGATTSDDFGVVTGLDPGTSYDFYVVALDAKGNSSPPSNIATGVTQGATVFYYRNYVAPATPGQVSSTGSWTNNEDGSAGSQPNFGADGIFLYLSNASGNTPTPPTLSNLWTVSGPSAQIVIGSGVTLNTSGANAGIIGNLEIPGTGKIVLSTNTQPTLVAVSQESTVEYSMASLNPGTTTVVQQVQGIEYGNLQLTGAGSLKQFQPGNTVVHGDLTIGNLVGITGAPNNGSTIILYGDLIYTNGAEPLFANADQAVILDIRKPTSQQLSFEGELILHEVKALPGTTVDINSGDDVAILTLGSSNGGGLTLPAGSSLRLSNNQTLKISGAGTINSAGETGNIVANGGSIEIESTSSATSNLYINQLAPGKVLKRLGFDAPNGQLRVWNALDIEDGLQVTSGDLYSNGNITLKSTIAKTANLEQIGEFGRVLGDVTVERYVQAKQNTYRYISASVADLIIDDWQAFFIISGNFAGRQLSNSASLFTWAINPATGRMEWRAYPQTSPIKSDQAPINRGIGYAAYMRNESDFTMSLTGVPYQGSIAYTTLVAPFSIGETYSFDGWNLLGNPYASTIQWNLNPAAWSGKNNISNIVSVRENVNPTDGHFLYYDALDGLGTSTGDDNGVGGTLVDGLIAPGQAFYVQTVGENPSLTINEAAKYAGQQTLFRQSGAKEVSHLRINLKGDSKRDETIVALTNYAKDEFEPMYDASKLKNLGVFNLSTITKNGVSVAVNKMSNEFCDKVVRLAVEDVNPGEYKLEFPDVSALFGVGSIHLVDKYTNTNVDIRKSNEYSFTVTTDTATFGKWRFEIAFNRPDIDHSVAIVNGTDCVEPGKITLSNSQKGATYKITDLSGNVLSAGRTSLGGEFALMVPAKSLKNGLNEFRIIAGFEGCGSSPLEQTVTMEYYAPVAVETNDLSTCFGSSAQVSVSTTNEFVIGYNWYDAGNTRIKGFNTSTMETSPIIEETIYSVAPVMKNGCEGYRSAFVVSPIELDEPELIFANDTLFVSATAPEFVWSRNGEVISVTSENFLAGLTPGTYSVTCKNGGCSKTSKQFSITANEDDSDIALQYDLYPNPASSGNINLRVTTPNREDIVVKVVDVLGREHYFKTFGADELVTPVRIQPKNEFRAGVYYLILKQESRMKEIKFMVKD